MIKTKQTRREIKLNNADWGDEWQDDLQWYTCKYYNNQKALLPISLLHLHTIIIIWTENRIEQIW